MCLHAYMCNEDATLTFRVSYSIYGASYMQTENCSDGKVSWHGKFLH